MAYQGFFCMMALVGLDGNSWAEIELYFIDIHVYAARPLDAALKIILEPCWIARLDFVLHLGLDITYESSRCLQ